MDEEARKRARRDYYDAVAKWAETTAAIEAARKAMAARAAAEAAREPTLWERTAGVRGLFEMVFSGMELSAPLESIVRSVQPDPQADLAMMPLPPSPERPHWAFDPPFYDPTDPSNMLAQREQELLGTQWWRRTPPAPAPPPPTFAKRAPATRPALPKGEPLPADADCQGGRLP